MAFNAASTTDSIEDIAAALGEPAPTETPADANPADKPADEAPKKADPPASTETPADPSLNDDDEEGDVATPPADAKATDEQPAARRNKPRAADRINQLTAENRRREMRERELARENEELRRQVAAKPAAAAEPKAEAAAEPTTKVVDPNLPKQENFESFDEFVEAMTDYKSNVAVAKALADRDAKANAEREQAERDREQRAFEASLDSAAATYPDYHQVLEAGGDLPVTVEMKDAIMTSPVAGHLMYFLNRNSDLCVKLSKMRPSVAVKEIGKIESAIARAFADDKKPSEGKPTEKPTEKPSAESRQASRAPQPPPSVRSGSTGSGLPKDLTQVTNFKDYEAIRAAQEAAAAERR